MNRNLNCSLNQLPETEDKAESPETEGMAESPVSGVNGVKSSWFGLERLSLFFKLGVWILKLLGLYKRGYRNAGTIIYRRLDWFVPGLPAALSGLKILFLSDLHLDGPVRTTESLLELLPAIDADITLLGGDYCWGNFTPVEPAIQEIKRLLPSLVRPLGVYAVLGNHDPPVLFEALDRLRLKVLANSSEVIEYNGEKLYLVGLEDCHLYKRDDFDKAMKEVPQCATTLVLCHALDLVREASERGCNMYLTGHTHWGQIALPGGKPVLTHSTPGKKFAKGFWKLGQLRGYTTSGAGTAGMPARFNTRSEVVTLTLKPEE